MTGVANAIIAGVNKAGTTSLFVSLAGPSRRRAGVGEGDPLLPPGPLGPRARARVGLRDVTSPTPATAGPARGDARVLLRRPALVDAVREVCGDAHVLVVLREPVAPLLSFFTYQKARLRVPET